MNRARRWKLSAAQRTDMWNGWTIITGDWSSARQEPCVIQFLLARHGGIAPTARRRSRLALTLAEREDHLAPPLRLQRLIVPQMSTSSLR